MEDVFMPSLSDPRHTVESVTDPSKREQIKRTCLNCDKTFLTKSRFNRICRSCRRLNRGIDQDWFGVKSHVHEGWID
jgi:hypothetical protein